VRGALDVSGAMGCTRGFAACGCCAGSGERGWQAVPLLLRLGDAQALLLLGQLAPSMRPAPRSPRCLGPSLVLFVGATHGSVCLCVSAQTCRGHLQQEKYGTGSGSTCGLLLSIFRDARQRFPGARWQAQRTRLRVLAYWRAAYMSRMLGRRGSHLLPGGQWG
jgi:hypothetical protein